MKIPLEWLKEYVNTDKSVDKIAESFTAIGLMLDKPTDGKVLDLEHRMDRSDWLSLIGCARDFAAYEGIALKEPELREGKGKPGGNVHIGVEAADVCYRFNTRVFRNIKVGESPDWLKRRLTEYGMTPKNNIVDITNYVMIEYGNPLHAQDLAKFEKREIIIRRAREGETVVTLDGTKVTLDPHMFVLSQNNKATVIGGVVGSASTAVDEDTTEIILDAGNYDQANVRKTARKIKIQNETVLRYDKYLHPKNTEYAIKRATELILELAGGEFYENEDYYPNPVPEKHMSLRMERLELIGGRKFDIENVKEILVRLGYKITDEKEDLLFLEVPFFRTDVEVEDDIASDVLRISGYSNIESELISMAPPAEITPEIYRFEDRLRRTLVGLGLHEHITNPLVEYSESSKEQIKLENSLSPEQSALRTSIYHTLFPVTGIYGKHGQSSVGVFEIGKIYIKEELNEVRIATVIYLNREISLYENSVEVKKILAGTLRELGVNDFSIEKEEDTHLIKSGKLQIGNIYADHFNLFVEEILKLDRKEGRVITEFKNFITEDLSITVPEGEEFGGIINLIRSSTKKMEKIYAVEEYFNAGKRSVLVRMEFDSAKTKQEEINLIKQEILKEIEKKLSN
jgi:phenylalanyl-tRNA synthetase beta chain